MLVVRPNKRRMRQFRDSPAENALAPTRRSRFAGGGVPWRRAAVIACVAGALIVVFGLLALTGHLSF